MNVVIDTNVWISALISKNGMSREIIRLALLDKIHPQISTTLFLEYETVMKREKIINLCSLTQKEQEEIFQAYLSTCKWNEIFYLWRPNLNDENDDFLVELAVASNSEIIITDNKKDLESGELHFNFEVLTPQEFFGKVYIMSTLTLRIPDSKYDRLKSYAKSKEISLNKLFDEFATIALTQFDAKTRFDLMVAKSNRKKGLNLLDVLDEKIT